VQRYYGVLVPKGRLAIGFSVVLGLVKCMFWFYGPQRRKLKSLTPELREGLSLTLEKCQMLASIEPLAFATQAFIAGKQFLRYDLRDSEPGLMALIGISGFFSWPGISLPVSRRVLERMSRIIGPVRPRVWIFYLCFKTMFCLISGEWEERESFRDPLIERQSEQGNVDYIQSIFYYTCIFCIECGDWDTFLDARHMLQETSERFDNDEGRRCLNLVKLRYYIKRRMAEEASGSIPGFLKFSASRYASVGESLLSWAYAVSSRVALLCGDFEKAVADLNHAPKSFVKSTGSVLQNGILYMANAAIAVEQARKAAVEGKLDRAPRRACLAALHLYLKNTRKYVPDLTEALKFFGTFWWYAGSRRRALSYWRQSIREGERLGAKVELAHTFADAGKLLGEMAPGPEWRKRGAELYAELGIRGNG
jgi:hypothetical protein